MVQGYARTYRSNAVLTASPGQLVLMLYDGALRSLALARDALERPEGEAHRFEVINRELLKAQAIIAELQGGLNFSDGGEVAPTLDKLYDYYNRRIFEANLRKELSPVIEVEGLLNQLRASWAEMLTAQPINDERPELIRGVA